MSLPFIALFAALIAVSGIVAVPVGPFGLPIVFQNLFVVLAGLILGPLRGAAAVLLWILAGALGLPVFSGARGGFAHLLGPTGGFFVGYILAALLAGVLAGRSASRLRLAVAALAGFIILYIPGIAWFMHVADKPLAPALTAACLPFLPGDTLKFLLVLLVLPRLRRRDSVPPRAGPPGGPRAFPPVGPAVPSGPRASAEGNQPPPHSTFDIQHSIFNISSSSSPAVSVHGLVKRFDDVTALADVAFSLAPGSLAVVAGANGSGKTVLMTILAGLEKPTAGTVAVDGRAGLVFQEADAQILGETPREDVAFGPKNQGLRGAALGARVDDALARAGLAALADFPAHDLSGGGKRRLAVAGVLAMDLPLVIFDEPYANLDYEGVRTVNTLIVDLHRSGRTVIVLTHELEKILGLADRLLVLDHGRLVFDGTPAGGLAAGLERWGIRDPRRPQAVLEDLVWR